MTALAGWVGQGPADGRTGALLGAAAARGAERVDTVAPSVDGDSWQEGLGCGLGVARRVWEFGPSFSGPVGILHEDDVYVSADASLYYRDDLVRALGDERPRGGTPSHAIAAAYRKWGIGLGKHLEGDFSFLVFDAGSGTVLACRDFAGNRPLYFAETPGGIALASDPRGLLDVPGVDSGYDLHVLAGTAAALLSAAGPDTCFRGIKILPAGHTLTWRAGEGVQLRAHWSPPRWTRPRESFAEAARTLRKLLIDATRERLSLHGTTGVSLSGGWDSPAVFAAAREHVRLRGTEDRIVPVSISYPEGDPGREDEWIQEILDRWGAEAVWLQAYDIPLLSGADGDAADRPLPWAHLYEHWNRALADAVRDAGGRVLLTGYGGDQLFQVSDVYLSDLTWSLRLGQAYREFKAKGGVGFKSFFRWGVMPGMGPTSLALARFLRRGKPLAGYMKRGAPAWIRLEAEGLEGLMEREARHEPTRDLRSRVEAEANWYLTEAMFPRVNAEVTRFALEADVELRSPLYDRRIVEFAATRPWSDRSQGKETKRLLREACRGLVPDAVLAPRPARTGTPLGYLRRALDQELPSLLEDLREEPLHMADLGIVDADQFYRACDRVVASEGSGLELPVMQTLHTELWLRGQEARAASTPTVTPTPETARVSD